MPPRLYVIGSGSHADVVAAILSPETPERITLEEFAQLRIRPEDTFVCAIGDNVQRKKTVQSRTLEVNPKQWRNAIHRTAFIDPTVVMGHGNVICAGAILQNQAAVQDFCIINTNASVDHHCQVHSFVHIAPNVALCGHVLIGQGAFVGTSCSVLPRTQVAPFTLVKAGTVLKHSTGPIPMYIPYLPGPYLTHAMEVLASGDLTAMTPHNNYVGRCETILQTRFGTRHAILVNNGTSATHLLFLALKWRYPEISKIYLPNHVYVAVWNTCLYEFAEREKTFQTSLAILGVNVETWNMDTSEETLAELETGAALVVVHNLGNIVNIPRLKRLRPDLIILEDACEGFTGKHEGSYAGTQSWVASISFFANKTITSGEGGCVFTQDDDLASFLRKTISQGQTSERYVHDVLGYNYRITNIQAALLFAQLDDLDTILNLKATVFAAYRRGLATAKNFVLAQPEPDTVPAQWMMAVRCPDISYAKQIQPFCQKQCIETRPMFFAWYRHLHLQDSFIRAYIDSFPYDEIVMLPSYPSLTSTHIEFIVEQLLWVTRNGA